MTFEEAIVECLRRSPEGLPASVLDGRLQDFVGLDWGEYRAAMGRLEEDGRIVGETSWQGGRRWLIWRLPDVQLESGGPPDDWGGDTLHSWLAMAASSRSRT